MTASGKHLVLAGGWPEFYEIIRKGSSGEDVEDLAWWKPRTEWVCHITCPDPRKSAP